MRTLVLYACAWIAALVSGCHESSVATTVPSKRVVYVSYVDSKEDARGQADFRTFRDAVAFHADPKSPKIALEFAEVAGAGKAPIADLMRRTVDSHPDAIVASSSEVLEAAKELAATIPVLFMSHADPVELDHVNAIAKPGVNRTGFTFYAPVLTKSLDLLKEAYPHIKTVGIITDSALRSSAGFITELTQARTRPDLEIKVFIVETGDKLKALLEGEGQTIDAWYIPTTAVLWNDREGTLSLIETAAKPVIYDRTALAQRPASMAYEARVRDPFSIWASQLRLILDGVEVRTIPVERPSTFELAVNISRVTTRPSLMPSKEIVRWAEVVVGQP